MQGDQDSSVQTWKLGIDAASKSAEYFAFLKAMKRLSFEEIEGNKIPLSEERFIVGINLVF